LDSAKSGAGDVGILGKLAQIFSYLFHLALSLFVGGMAAVGCLSGSSNFALGMIPWWSGQTLVRWLLGAALVGLLLTILAVLGRLRALFGLWTLIVLCVVVYGFFLSNYTYPGPDEFKSALWLAGGAALACLGGIKQARRAVKRIR
jgi:hypothetical protein